MGKSSTVRVDRPPVSDIAFSKIPFGPVVCRLRPGTVKVLAAIVRSSWVDSGTRRRVTRATNRRLAELAAVADPQTIATHLAELAEAGVVTLETDDERHRVIVVHERAEGIGDMFVSIPDSHPAWKLKPGPFVLFLAVRSFDTQNVGYSLMRNRRLAARLNWSDRAVERAMATLRLSGTVETKSIFNPSRLTRKRVVYAPNPTPNPEQNGPGGYEKAGHLYGHDGVRKSGACTYEKAGHAPTKKCHPPLRKSGALSTNSENEFLERTLTTNQPAIESTGQSERAETAEAEVVVVVDVKTSTDTGPEPKAGAGGPPELSEVVAILAKSQLSRDEQERYLATTRKMIEPPPIAWHVHALDVKPSSGTKSIAGVVISRLKAWTTTPTDQRAAIVDEIAARDAEVIAKRLRSAGFWYKANLGILKADSGQITAAEVRRSWEQYNAALAAAGQPAVQLPNEVLHAEEAKRKRAEQAAEFARAEAKRANEETLRNCEKRIEDTKRQLGLYGMGDITCESEKFERTSDAIKRVSLDMTPEEYRSALKGIFIEAFPFWEELEKREQDERLRAKAEERKRERIESQRVEIEKEIRETVNLRISAWSLIRQKELKEKGVDANTVFQRIREEWPVEKERFEAAVRAEFAPKFAALGPPPPPARARKPPGPPPGPPATIPAMASR